VIRKGQKEISMKTTIPAAFAVIVLSIMTAPRAKAACTAHNGGMFASGLESLQGLAALDPEDSLDQAGPLEAPDREKNDSQITILGLWKKIWFSGGALNDVGFAHFNAGGTELVNDVGALNGGNNFCIGAWKKVGQRTYELVHPFFVFDDSGKNVIAVAIEKSRATVSRDGNTFRGKWTQDNYDLSGNLIAGFHVDGTIVGTRITPGLPFPFPFPF
jgi:hypothetical protein